MLCFANNKIVYTNNCFIFFFLQKFRSAHTAAKSESGIEILTKQEPKVSLTHSVQKEILFSERYG